MGGCQYICVNTIGSYHCDCPTGFTLTEDERTCRGIHISETLVILYQFIMKTEALANKGTSYIRLTV